MRTGTQHRGNGMAAIPKRETMFFLHSSRVKGTRGFSKRKLCLEEKNVKIKKLGEATRQHPAKNFELKALARKTSKNTECFVSLLLELKS